MAVSQLTVTGKVGPNKTVTAGVFTGVSSFGVDGNGVLTFVDSQGRTNIFDISAATTWTVTVVASGNYTVVIS